jgi:ribonuclease Z
LHPNNTPGCPVRHGASAGRTRPLDDAPAWPPAIPAGRRRIRIAIGRETATLREGKATVRMAALSDEESDAVQMEFRGRLTGPPEAMRVRIVPRLVNRRDQDPGLFIDLEGARDAFLVDCGSTDPIPKADLLRLSHVFVSHTHIDHFCGFDRILRNVLGQVVHITVFGPPGITRNVQGKLDGYTWNLIDEDGPVFTVRELSGERVTVTTLRCRKGFSPEAPAVEVRAPGGLILADGRVRVHYAALEHSIPSLAYSIQEEPFASIRVDALRRTGLREGPWLKLLQEKALARAAAAAAAPSRSPGEEIDVDGRRMPLERLLAELVQIKPGRKVTYVTDTVFNERTCRIVADLARGSDVFYCEANYQEEDVARAAAYAHLTARQAATFAREANARKLVLFHVSRKYHGDIRTSIREAVEVFPRTE